MEEEPDSMYYSMQELFKGVEEDLKRMNGILKGKFIRFMSSEQEEIRRWYMDWIYREMEEIFKAVLENMEVEKQVDVFYGSYMDKLKKIGWV